MEPKKTYSCEYYIQAYPTFTGCLINKSGYKVWYKDGLKHREDGPAIEWKNGDKKWWLNNVQYTKQEWIIATRKIKIERVLKAIDNENNTL